MATKGAKVSPCQFHLLYKPISSNFTRFNSNHNLVLSSAWENSIRSHAFIHPSIQEMKLAFSVRNGSKGALSGNMPSKCSIVHTSIGHSESVANSKTPVLLSYHNHRCYFYVSLLNKSWGHAHFPSGRPLCHLLDGSVHLGGRVLHMLDCREPEQHYQMVA